MLFKCQRANAYRDSISVLRIAVKEIRRNYAFDVRSSLRSHLDSCALGEFAICQLDYAVADYAF